MVNPIVYQMQSMGISGRIDVRAAADGLPALHVVQQALRVRAHGVGRVAAELQPQRRALRREGLRDRGLGLARSQAPKPRTFIDAANDHLRNVAAGARRATRKPASRRSVDTPPPISRVQEAATDCPVRGRLGHAREGFANRAADAPSRRQRHPGEIE